MLEKVSRECTRIAQSLDRINAVNQLLELILDSTERKNSSCELLLQLFSSLPSSKLNSSLQSFIDEKLMVIGEILLSQLHDKHVDLKEIAAAVQTSLTLHSSKPAFASWFFKHEDSPKLFSSLTNTQFVYISATLLQDHVNQIQFQPTILSFLTDLPAATEFSPDEGTPAMKKAFQTLVMAFIAKADELSVTQLYRKFGEKILSKMENPLILSQHFLEQFSGSPEAQIEVISCLFILVGKYGLSFEEFYPRLQSLIQRRNIYNLPNSKRFFKLVQSALRSSKVPFRTIHDFVKIILGQVFTESSEFAYWGLSLIVNLTKKHRRLLDVVRTIPELVLLRRHYSPKIRGLLKELDGNLNEASYLDIDQFAQVNCKKLTRTKLNEVVQKMGQDAQWHI